MNQLLRMCSLAFLATFYTQIDATKNKTPIKRQVLIIKNDKHAWSIALNYTNDPTAIESDIIIQDKNKQTPFGTWLKNIPEKNDFCNTPLVPIGAMVKILEGCKFRPLEIAIHHFHDICDNNELATIQLKNIQLLLKKGADTSHEIAVGGKTILEHYKTADNRKNNKNTKELEKLLDIESQ